ncbi:transglutaminase domain-containing protein [Candidatus Microgenomates bacterium]|nr:transglutaminase domain-containing protein [Candidatus Microgenomates bacterium]
MKKFFLFFCTFLFLFSGLTSGVSADGEFNTDFDVTYTVSETGVTTVSNQVTLTNIFSNLYASSYSIVLDSMAPSNIRSFDGNGAVYNVKTTVDGTKTTISVSFPDNLVGKDKSRTFWVNYDEPSFAVRTGEVWEVSIPRLSESSSFSSYFVTLSVPSSFGQEAYLSPRPRQRSTNGGMQEFKFNIEDVASTGIVAGFGQFQVFSFTLYYHLENPLTRTATTEVALPPDTAFQRMYYHNLNPKPKSIHVDTDGNWIATYEMKARERIDVVAKGSVQIFSTLRNFPKPTIETLNKNLQSTPYWQSSDPTIMSLATRLKTPKAIYDYVTNTFTYDYSRVRPNVERLGAISALEQPSIAICMEYTDSFIALARAAGIPAREINGYAYTENPEIQPLSLVNDVLHAWPEYYDSTRGAWIPIDPTWGSTTGGVDYFNKLDLRHFTFVIHGEQDSQPYSPGSYKLGTNPQKDVFVSFGSLPEERNSKPTVTAQVGGWIPFLPNKLKLKIDNPGPVALYSVTPTILFDQSATESKLFIESLLPFQTYEISLDIPFSFLGTNTPEKVTVLVEGESVTVPTNKNQVVIYNLLFIFFSTILVLLTFLFRLKKWKVNFNGLKAILFSVKK